MTVRGMVRISAIGAGLILALTIVASLAHAQGQPQVSIEPRIHRDTTARPTANRQILFGFSQQVLTATELPVTAPMRSFCAIARRDGDVVVVDSVVARVDAELPSCPPEQVPLAIRPTCELTMSEHLTWIVQKLRPAILFCGEPSQVYLLGTGSRTAGQSAQ